MSPSRTPLNAIIGFSDDRRSPRPGRQRAYLATSRHQRQRRTFTIINDIPDLPAESENSG